MFPAARENHVGVGDYFQYESRVIQSILYRAASSRSAVTFRRRF